MLRLTGGEFRGRAIETPKGEHTRPTQSKLRQALFNSLQTRIAGATVLDLFAGSGALGFEALSRGADQVTFVESVKPVAKLIQKNAQTLGVQDKAAILTRDVEELLGVGGFSGGPFDIVLADPPYIEGWELKLLERFPWESCLSVGGVFSLEWGIQKSVPASLPDELPFLVKVREKNYGDSVLTTYQRRG